jgi:chemotaxis protein CheX
VQVKYIQPFIDATIKVFKEFVGVDIVPGAPFVFKHSENQCQYDISGIIGIAGQTIGIVVVSFPENVALDFTSATTGEKATEFNDTVIDLVGEIINIIAGNAKQGLEQYKLVISLPTIITGYKHQISGVSGVPLIGIPFTSGENDIYLFVSLKDLITN